MIILGAIVILWWRVVRPRRMEEHVEYHIMLLRLVVQFLIEDPYAQSAMLY